MPRSARPWFRFYVETISDRKIRRLDMTQRWIWVAILAAACDSPERGHLFIAENLPMSEYELAEYAGVKEREVRVALQLMADVLHLVTIGDAGLISVTNWEKRQYESDNVTDRVRTHRERSKERSNVVTGNVGSNAPETETETETEKDSLPRKRATRISDDWKPTPALIEWQREANISDLLARRELPKFIDYWQSQPGQRATKTDWPATWRNWLRTALEREPRALTPAAGGKPPWEA